MRSRVFVSLLSSIIVSGAVQGFQVGGGAIYDPRTGNALNQPRLESFRTPTSSTRPVIEATVLLNQVPDTFVAVFALSAAHPTMEECRAELKAKVAELRKAITDSKLPIQSFDVDYVTQGRAYDFKVTGNTAQQSQNGFEVKENVAITYGDSNSTVGVLAAAASVKVFDLIKIDCYIKDLPGAQASLRAAARKVISKKLRDYQEDFGISMKAKQVITDRSLTTYPTQRYESYQAFDLDDDRRIYSAGNYNVILARKLRTFHYSPIDQSGFDVVINPIVSVPSVQIAYIIAVELEPTRQVSQPASTKLAPKSSGKAKKTPIKS